MSDLIKVDFVKPEIPGNWNYDESVKKVKGFVYKAKNLTQEIKEELWIAREVLSRSGAAGHVKNLSEANALLKTWNQYCKDIGIDKSTANRWLNPKSIIAHVAQSTGETEWDTPSEFIQAARQVMGKIDVDPASNERANKRIHADKFYTMEDSGLNKTWHGNVWMNPPYSQPLITQFCNLIVEKYKNNEIKQACILVNNATETNFFQNMLSICIAICFIRGRVKFIDKAGNSSGAPLQGQSILYLGNNLKGFIQEYETFGIIMVKHHG